MAYVQDDSGKRAFGMGMAMAVNGSIIAAIMLSPMIVKSPERGGRTTIMDIPDRQPPPPEKPRIEQQSDTPKKIDPIYTPPTPYTPERADPGPTVTDIDPGPVTGLDGGEIGGKGGGGEVATREIIETPPPLPFVSARRDPGFARGFQPEYPPGLLSKEIEGDAVIRVLIGADGRVREAIVVRATHADFGKYAVKKALSSWRFIPARRGGKPVEDWQTIPVRFKITR